MKIRLRDLFAKKVNKKQPDHLKPKLEEDRITKMSISCRYCGCWWEVYEPDFDEDIVCPCCKINLSQTPTEEEIAQAKLKAEEFGKNPFEEEYTENPFAEEYVENP